MRLKQEYKTMLLDYIGKIIAVDHRLKYWTNVSPNLVSYECSEEAIRKTNIEYQKLISSLLRSVANIARDEYVIYD